MTSQFINEREKNLAAISARHENREIEGCTSWRHFVVHEDRAWLLSALAKIQDQVEKVRQASGEASDKQVLDVEVQNLLAMFEAARLNHLGDE